jgi:hypothetical protein
MFQQQSSRRRGTATRKFRNVGEHRDFLGVIVLVVIGVVLVAVAPARQPIERMSGPIT